VIATRQRTAPEIIAAGGLEIRPGERLALADGRTLPLSSRELALPAELARSRGASSAARTCTRPSGAHALGFGYRLAPEPPATAGPHHTNERERIT
jgi:hypothetical protein